MLHTIQMLTLGWQANYAPVDRSRPSRRLHPPRLLASPPPLRASSHPWSSSSPHYYRRRRLHRLRLHDRHHRPTPPPALTTPGLRPLAGHRILKGSAWCSVGVVLVWYWRDVVWVWCGCGVGVAWVWSLVWVWCGCGSGEICAWYGVVSAWCGCGVVWGGVVWFCIDVLRLLRPLLLSCALSSLRGFLGLLG